MKHRRPRDFGDKCAFWFTMRLRWIADTFFAKRYGHRAVVLETVAGVPGMVAGMWNHLRSLRKMRPDDRGWIRQLLEEANDFLVSKFGDSKLVYCHDPSWTWMMQEVIGMNDKGQKGMYLRLPIWRKGPGGKAISNERNSSGTGGEFTLEHRQKKRLRNRSATAREKDAARKARDKKKRKQMEAL